MTERHRLLKPFAFLFGGTILCSSISAGAIGAGRLFNNTGRLESALPFVGGFTLSDQIGHRFLSSQNRNTEGMIISVIAVEGKPQIGILCLNPIGQDSFYGVQNTNIQLSPNPDKDTRVVTLSEDDLSKLISTLIDMKKDDRHC